jgi:hypothetical protein
MSYFAEFADQDQAGFSQTKGGVEIPVQIGSRPEKELKKAV